MKRYFRFLFMTLLVLLVVALVLPITAKRPDQHHSDTFELVEATIDDIQDAYDSHLLTPSQLVSMYLATIKLDQA